jgi:general secretion pathway protein K
VTGCTRARATPLPRTSDTAARERGVALVIVIWTLALLAILAGSFSGASRTHARLAFNIVERTRAEALADAAVERAIAGILIPAEAGGLRVDQTPYAWVFEGGEVVFSIADEGGKIDLNAAEVELLADLFTALGLSVRESVALAAAIADYADDDDEERPGGAEAAAYRRARLSYGPKNAPFERIDELSRVLGMTPELFSRVRPLITTYTGMAQPDGNVLPPEYRLLLQGVLNRQGGGDGESAAGGSADPDADTGPGAVRQRPRPAGETSLLTRLRVEGTDARSGTNIFTIHAEARTAAGGLFVREAVVVVEPEAIPPFRFLDLRQGARQFLVGG